MSSIEYDKSFYSHKNREALYQDFKSRGFSKRYYNHKVESLQDGKDKAVLASIIGLGALLIVAVIFAAVGGANPSGELCKWIGIHAGIYGTFVAGALLAFAIQSIRLNRHLKQEIEHDDITKILKDVDRRMTNEQEKSDKISKEIEMQRAKLVAKEDS